jgi:hypothetical protein
MPGTPGFIRKLTGPTAWSSVSVASKTKRSSPSAPRFAGEREAQAERPVAVAVGIDRVGEAVRPVGEGLGELPAHEAPRPGEELVERVPERVGAEARDDLLDAPDAELDAAQERPHVAEALVGEARVAVEDGERRLVRPPSLDQPRRRNDNAFLEDVGGVGADGARPQASDVGEMGPGHHECRAPPLVEDGGDQDLGRSSARRRRASRSSRCTSRRRPAAWSPAGRP